MMKRLVLIIAVAALGWSCTASEEPADGRLQEIRIGISGILSGDIATKGMSEALSSTAPSGVPTLQLVGVDVTTRSYSVRPGESVTVPVGKYSVSGSYRPTKQGEVGGNALYHEPSYEVSGQIDVVQGVSGYSVPATYDCAVIAVGSDVDYVEGATTGTYSELSAFKAAGDVRLLYVRLAYNLDWKLRVYPVELDEHEMRQFTLVSGKAQTGAVFVEKGKWYLFSPGEVDKQDGDITIELPEFGEGGV